MQTVLNPQVKLVSRVKTVKNILTNLRETRRIMSLKTVMKHPHSCSNPHRLTQTSRMANQVTLLRGKLSVIITIRLRKSPSKQLRISQPRAYEIKWLNPCSQVTVSTRIVRKETHQGHLMKDKLRHQHCLRLLCTRHRSNPLLDNYPPLFLSCIRLHLHFKRWDPSLCNLLTTIRPYHRLALLDWSQSELVITHCRPWQSIKPQACKEPTHRRRLK